MSGRHRKPTHTGLRLARMGALTVMAMTPLAMTGTALAAPSDSDLDPPSSADPDSSGWTDDADRSDASDRSDGSYRSDRSDGSDLGDDEAADPADLHSFDWRDSASPRSTHRVSITPTRSSTTADPTASTAPAAPTASAASLAKWDKLAECESTRNWSANTGSYRGGLQFSDATWRRYGGGQYATSADRASRAQQIAVAEKVRQAQGWKAWPACSQKLGYS